MSCVIDKDSYPIYEIANHREEKGLPPITHNLYVGDSDATS